MFCFMQLLHNDLIPDIPMALKVKIAYQAAKGMHFLHSSGTSRVPHQLLLPAI